MMLKQRPGLKHQTGKCNKGNPQIAENIWPDSWSAIPDLVVVAYCKLDMWNMWTKCSAVNNNGEKKGADISLGCLNWNFVSNMKEGHCFVFPGIFEPSARTWMQYWVSPFKTDIQKGEKYGRKKNRNEKFSRFNLWGKVEEIRLFCSRKKRLKKTTVTNL